VVCNAQVGLAVTPVGTSVGQGPLVHSGEQKSPGRPVTCTAISSAPQPSNSGLPNPYDVTSPSPPGHQSDHTFGDHEDYDSGSPTALRDEEQRMSYQDGADYSQGNRVLRVANE